MIIGIDIDDTISKTNEKIVEVAYNYDKEYLKGRGYKDRSAYNFMEMFYWNVMDMDSFFKYIKKNDFFLELEPKEDASKYINILKDEGYKIYFVTRRDNSFKVRSKTKKWLKMNGFNYDKLILGAKDKAAVAKRNKISLFLDNDVNNYSALKEVGVKSYLMTDQYNGNYNVHRRVNNFKEFYDVVKGE